MPMKIKTKSPSALFKFFNDVNKTTEVLDTIGFAPMEVSWIDPLLSGKTEPLDLEKGEQNPNTIQLEFTGLYKDRIFSATTKLIIRDPNKSDFAYQAFGRCSVMFLDTLGISPPAGFLVAAMIPKEKVYEYEGYIVEIKSYRENGIEEWHTSVITGYTNELI